MPMPTYPKIDEKVKTFPFSDLVEMTKFKHMPMVYHHIDEYDDGFKQDMDVMKKSDPCAGVPLSSPLFVLLCKRARGSLTLP